MWEIVGALVAAGSLFVGYLNYTSQKKTSDLLHARELFKEYMVRRIDAPNDKADPEAHGNWLAYKLFVLEEIYLWVTRRRAIVPSTRASVQAWKDTIQLHLCFDPDDTSARLARYSKTYDPTFLAFATGALAQCRPSSDEEAELSEKLAEQCSALPEKAR